MIKLAVCGALGRMGQKVIQAAMERPEIKVSGAIERPDCPSLGQPIGPIIGQPELMMPLTSNFQDGAQDAGVYIDFTAPESSLNYLAQAVKMKLAAVIGTTGFNPDQVAIIQKAAQQIPVLWAPNMSTGVNVLYKIAEMMTKMLGSDFDIEIVEAHHRLKKDAPSGTALKIQETIAQARGLSPAQTRVSGRDGQVGARTAEEIGVMAIRGGDIVGDHTIFFCGPGERLELTHRAHTRDTFAQGAVRAALWLAGRSPGLYGIDDTLGF